MITRLSCVVVSNAKSLIGLVNSNCFVHLVSGHAVRSNFQNLASQQRDIVSVRGACCPGPNKTQIHTCECHVADQLHMQTGGQSFLPSVDVFGAVFWKANFSWITNWLSKYPMTPCIFPTHPLRDQRPSLPLPNFLLKLSTKPLTPHHILPDFTFKTRFSGNSSFWHLQ